MTFSPSDFPPSIECDWAGPPLKFRFGVPKVWTQRESRSFAVYWSSELDYGRLYPTPTPEELRRFYATDSYRTYMNPSVTSGAGHLTPQTENTISDRLLMRLAWLADRGQSDPVATIRRLARTSDEPTICDLGCGSGSFLARMVAAGFRVTGVDPSEDAKREAAVKGFEFCAGTAEQIPVELAGRKFGVVTMFHSLEHCTNPARALRNVRSLLGSDGLACIEVPNHGCIDFDTWGPSWFHTDAGRHLYFFTKSSLQLALSNAGLQVRHWEYDQFTRQFSRAWLRAMQEVWDRMHEGKTAEFPRPTGAGRMLQLIRALAARPERRYDVIRVYASRPA